MRRMFGWAGAMLVAWLAPVGAQAAVQSMEVEVVETRASRTGGGCLVKISPAMDMSGMCLEDWITFGCADTDGDGDLQADALLLYDAAQLAHATGRSIRITVDDQQKRGDYCLATEIDVLDAAD